jgi:hypothetical protein
MSLRCVVRLRKEMQRTRGRKMRRIRGQENTTVLGQKDVERRRR